MKNLICLLFLALTFSFATSLNAQEYSAVNVKNNGGDVEILENFKATKDQKKVIKKIQKYVGPKVLDRGVNGDAFQGKAVKVQMGLDANGGIDYLVVVEGLGPKLDEKVVNLIKEYTETKSLASSGMATPAVIQMDIPVVMNSYYGSF
ncbi:MAG: hypothetical protein AAFZ15_12555 [Bacteroidota bacterium]